MQREITINEVEKTLMEDNLNDTILVKRKNKTDAIIMSIEEYKKMFETKFIQRLKRGEEQIENGEVTDGNIVLKKMREKYGY